MFQTFADMDFVFTPFLAFFILLLLLFMQYYFYKRITRRNWLMSVIVYVFSLIIGATSFTLILPFNPWFQVFFVIFQTIIFYLSMEKVFR